MIEKFGRLLADPSCQALHHFEVIGLFEEMAEETRVSCHVDPVAAGSFAFRLPDRESGGLRAVDVLFQQVVLGGYGGVFGPIELLVEDLCDLLGLVCVIPGCIRVR